MARSETEEIDPALLALAKAQGFRMFVRESDSFWLGDVEEFWYISPDGKKSKTYDTFDEFEDALEKAVSRRPIQRSMSLQFTQS